MEKKIRHWIKDIRNSGTSKSDGICWSIAEWRELADYLESTLNRRPAVSGKGK